MPAKTLASRRTLFLVACCALAAAVSHGARGDPLSATLADPPDVYSMPPDVLERAFWLCDHTATVHGVDATPVAECTSVFEALKVTRFGGDFSQLLGWWRENKPVEHTKLETR